MNCFVSILIIALFLLTSSPISQAQTRCAPTAPDMEGPFYKPNAPIRDSTGSGLTVSGKVKSADSCAPVSGARIEWWQASPEGKYDDAHRGALITGRDGIYRFETDYPPGYYGRPPHIHFKILAPGHRALTTQVYLQEGQKSISFDFVLLEEAGRGKAESN